MLKFLIEAFKASKGRMPNNMEMILLKQKAAKQSIDERKVVSMFDRSAVNPNKPIMGGKNIPETEEEIRQRLLKNNEKGLASMKSKLEDPEKKAMGGRIGYKVGTGKKGVEGLIDLIRNKFGKKSITTADKAPIPPKTLERDMFKKANEKFNKKEGVFMEDGKTPDYDYYKEILDDAEDSRGFNVAGDETIEELLRREKNIKDEYDYMYNQYKTGKLDPEPGSKSQARLNLLKKRKEEAELTGDYRLFNRDDADELDELEEFLDQDYKRVKAEQTDLEYEKNLKGLEDLGASKLAERFKLKKKYPGITDDLLDKILIDDNVQRKAEVLATID